MTKKATSDSLTAQLKWRMSESNQPAGRQADDLPDVCRDAQFYFVISHSMYLRLFFLFISISLFMASDLVENFSE